MTAMPWGAALVRLVASVLVTSLAFVTACRNDEPARGRASGLPGAPREEQLVVFAAASLRDAFTRLETEFRRAESGVSVHFNFAGTQELRAQLEYGAPGDVFASADERQMAALEKAGRVEAPVIFARGEPVIAVARESAGTIRALADLPKLQRLVIGAPEVPIGAYTLEILDRATLALGSDFRARVEARVVSRELNVRQVLAKLKLGEAQAGIVYRSDTRGLGDEVSVVTIPADVNVIAKYPIAVVRGTSHPRLSRDWIALVRSRVGRGILAEAGFLAAEAPEAAP